LCNHATDSDSFCCDTSSPGQWDDVCVAKAIQLGCMICP
jgi:hypothetical protein